MKIESFVKKQLDEYNADQSHDLLARQNQLDSLFSLCESPLEQRFLLGCIRELPGSVLVSDGNIHGVPTGMHWFSKELYELVCPGFEVRIYPQSIIDVPGSTYEPDRHKTYRCDFLFTIEYGHLSRWREGFDYVLERIVVEIDGHDFHERTRQQAERDRARDRHLTQHGYVVFRFTGSEIFNDCGSKIKEIRRYLWESSEKCANRLGLRFTSTVDRLR